MRPFPFLHSLACLAVLACLLYVQAAPAGPERREITIAVGGQGLFYYLPLAIAQQRGYFRDAGLEVEIADFPGGSKSLQAVVGGSAQVAAGAFEHVLNMQARGQELRAVVLLARYPGMVLALPPARAEGYRSAADLKGLKFRVGGLAGMVLAKLGVVPQQLAAGDLYPALEKGVIDAAEFVGPLDDEKLGLHKVAKYYYYPGWWEGSATLSLFINQKAWATLPAQYQVALRTAAAEANQWLTIKYDTENPQALRRLVAGGAQLRAFPKDVTQASYKAAQQLYEELSEKSPAFKKIYAHWSKFRAEQVMWQQFCDLPFDNLMTQLIKSK